LALASGLAAREYAIQGDFKGSLEAREETIRLSTELGFRPTNALGKINIAWLRARTGKAEGSADQIREGLAEFDAQKFFVYRSWNLQLLAEAQALSGSVDEALVTVEQAGSERGLALPETSAMSFHYRDARLADLTNISGAGGGQAHLH
jgi:hypothetical protein